MRPLIFLSSFIAYQGFFDVLRTELFDYPGITLSMICPGPVHSNIFQNAFTGDFTEVNIFNWKIVGMVYY